MFTRCRIEKGGQRIQRSPKTVVLAFGLLITGMVSPVLGQNEITFYFNPPDGTSFVETLRYTKSLSAPGVLQPETQVSEQKARYVIRKTDMGYSVEVRPIQPTLKVSEGTEGILRSMFSMVVVTYDLNAQGQLVRVRGTEPLMDKLKENIPQEMFQAVLSALGQAAQNPAQLAANMWNNRGMLGTFAGRTLKLNQVYQGSGNVPLPIGGSAVATMKIRTSWPAPCFGKRCAIVEALYESDDKTIGERLALMLRTMLVNLMKLMAPSFDEREIPHFQVTDSRTTVKTKRSVDPTTGLIYSENETRTLQAFFAVETQDKSEFVAKETFEYRYAYQ